MAETAAGAGRTVDLSSLEAVVGQWCDHTDAALLTGADAAVVAERLAVIGRRLAAQQASMAARAAACNAYAARAGSAEEWLARQNGTSRADAKRVLDTARRLSGCPAAQAAFESGALSLAEADAVTAAAVLDPASEAALVATATRRHDLAEVRDAADKVKRAARSGEDEAARVTRLRAGRRWREYTTGDGHRAVDARFVPEDLAAVLPVIDAFTDRQFRNGRTTGRRDTHEAYRADAVIAALAAAGATIGLDPKRTTATDAASTAAGATATTDSVDPAPTEPATAPVPHVADVAAAAPDRINWSMCVVVDAIALRRGSIAAGETCEIPGVGPVSVDFARTLMDTAVVDVLVHDLVDIRAYASLTRHKPRPLQLALKVRDPMCDVPGCRRRARLQLDHRHDFAKGGLTTLTNSDHLCSVHHDQKTHRGARLERTETEIHWYPPPPPPGTPPPPPDTVPWRAPTGRHLSRWNLDHPPDGERRSGAPAAPEPPADGDGRLPLD